MHSVSGKTIAGHLTNNKLKEVAAWQWSDSAMRDRLENGEEIEMCDRCIKIEYPNREDIKVTTSDIEFSGSLKIDLGGVCCEITEVGAPHSEDSVLIYVPEEKVVFVSDADCGDHYNNHGNYDKYKLEKYIEFIRKLHFNTCVLGHDEPESKEKALNNLEGELSNIK